MVRKPVQTLDLCSQPVVQKLCAIMHIFSIFRTVVQNLY